jgi:hypothetical protein
MRMMLIEYREETYHFLREILDKIVVEISSRFSHFGELKSRFGSLCNAQYPINQLDLQNHEQFTELQNVCTHLAHRYSEHLNVLELYQDCKDVVTSF